MPVPAKRVEVVHGSAWFATRLSALLAPHGIAVFPVESIAALCRNSANPSPDAIIFHLQPTAEPQADNIVSTLRRVREFAGPVIVLDRVRKVEGAVQFLPRDTAPARVASLVRQLVETAGPPEQAVVR